MSKVDDPKFDNTGELIGCHHCPLDSDDDDTLCILWWYRKTKQGGLVCPSRDSYQEAVELAEQEASK